MKRFFKHIQARDIAGAKAILKEDLVPHDDEERGRYMAARGMIGVLDNKNIDDGLFKDREKMARLRKRLIARMDSIWCDDFDRGYFDTWIRFINYYRRHGSGEAGGKEGVNKNPDEKKEHNKAP